MSDIDFIMSCSYFWSISFSILYYTSPACSFIFIWQCRWLPLLRNVPSLWWTEWRRVCDQQWHKLV